MKKLKNVFYIAVTMVCLLVITACGSNNNEPSVTTPVHRTILVYMASNNSLGSVNTNSDGDYVRADTLDIYEMKKAAKQGDFNGGRLLVYRSGSVDVNGDATATAKLYEVTEKGTLKVITDYANDGLSSVHSKRMKKVIADAKAAAPADEYGIILWSHGSGWLQDGIDESSSDDTSTKSSARRRAFGQENSKWMNITTLANVLDGENFAFVYFDCCYMASVEVEYELRKVTPYIVGSVTEIPLDGMPYDQNLKCLFANTIDLTGAARNTYNYYNKFSNYWRTCTMSVISTAGLDDLATATRNIYEKAETTWPSGYSPQRFAYGTCVYYDLGDYIKALASDEDYATWQKALDKCVIYAASTPYIWPGTSQQVALKSHCGLSTYIYNSKTDSTAAKKNYNTLSWYDDVVSYLIN